MIEREPADHRCNDDCNGDAGDQCQCRVAGAEAGVRKNQSGGVSADAEKRRLPERQDAGIAPKNIDRQRHRGIQESPDQAVDHVSRQHIGPDGDQQ